MWSGERGSLRKCSSRTFYSHAHKMTCYNTIEGYRQAYENENGKRPVRFSNSEGFRHNKMFIPCGKCVGCKLEYARQYAVRCYHEAKMHEANSFITLTYRPEEQPEDRSVSKREIQLFLKRLRKILGKEIRYFATGEYGEKGWKPHYHLIIFGYDFPDKVLKTVSAKGNDLYISQTLGKAWTKGFHSIGTVTMETASYVARYCMKKIDIVTHEDGRIPLLDRETGEYLILQPEFTLCSKGRKRGEGLGGKWFKQYWKDVYPKDFLTIEGDKHKPPKYYDDLMEDINPKLIKEVKEKRLKYMLQKRQESTMARAYVKETVKKAQISVMTRDLEE